MIDQISIGAFIGLMHRRLKWHIAERNRILSELPRLTEDEAAVRAFREAAMQHEGGIKELQALFLGREPSWDGERKITEAYLGVEYKEILDAIVAAKEALQEREPPGQSEPSLPPEEADAGQGSGRQDPPACC